MFTRLWPLLLVGPLSLLVQPTTAQPVDPAAKPGVYAETVSGVVLLTTYLEARQTLGGNIPVGSGEYLIPPGFAPQSVDTIRRFIVNSSDAAAEGALRLSAVRLHVTEAAEGAEPVAAFAQMSKKVLRTGVNLFEVTSSELDPAWLRKTVAKLAREKSIRTPAVFVEFQVRSLDGLAPRLYAVQIAL